MNWEGLAFQAVDGLASASGLFFVAAGLSLIFGVSRIINFAHGAIFMLGAYVAFTIVSLTGQSIASFLLALAASAAALSAGARNRSIRERSRAGSCYGSA